MVLVTLEKKRENLEKGKNKCIPPMCYFGQVSGYNVMVMGLLGPSLEDLFQYCGKQFSLKTTIMLAGKFEAQFFLYWLVRIKLLWFFEDIIISRTNSSGMLE